MIILWTLRLSYHLYTQGKSIVNCGSQGVQTITATPIRTMSPHFYWKSKWRRLNHCTFQQIGAM